MTSVDCTLGTRLDMMPFKAAISIYIYITMGRQPLLFVLFPVVIPHGYYEYISRGLAPRAATHIAPLQRVLRGVLAPAVLQLHCCTGHGTASAPEHRVRYLSIFFAREHSD